MRRAKAIVGYAIVLVLFVSLLALELAFVAMVVFAIIGIVILMKPSIWPEDMVMNLWRGIMILICGVVAGLGAVLTVWLPYQCIKGWMSTARQPSSPAT